MVTGKPDFSHPHRHRKDVDLSHENQSSSGARRSFYGFLNNNMKKILVIEDNKDILDNTVEILGLSNYEAIGASNGKEGIDAYSFSIPGEVISIFIFSGKKVSAVIFL